VGMTGFSLHMPATLCMCILQRITGSFTQMNFKAFSQTSTTLKSNIKVD
jgi:hypothetical protein